MRAALLAAAILSALCPTAGAYDASTLAVVSGEAEAPPEQIGLVSLYVNGIAFGEQEVFTDGTTFFLSALLVRDLLADLVEPASYSRIFGTLLAGRVWLGVEEFARAGLGYVEDPGSLRVDVEIPPAMRPVQSLGLRRDLQRNIKPILVPEPFAFMANTEFRAGFDLDGAGIAPTASARVNGAFHLLDWVGEGDASFGWDGAKFSADLRTARIVRDLYRLGARMTAGMAGTRISGFMTGSDVYGIALDSRDFQPVARGTPLPSPEFVLTRKSIVRMILNGTVLSSLDLEPGTYRVGDLDLPAGISEFIIEIEAPDEPPRSFRAVVSRDNTLLAAGRHEFSLTAGMGKSSGSELYASGFARWGLADDLTAGICFQADIRSALGGFTGTYAAPIGTFAFQYAGVGAWDDRPALYAHAAALRYRFSLPKRESAPNFGFDIEYRGRGFETPSPYREISDPAAFILASGQIALKVSRGLFTGLSGSLNRTLDATRAIGVGVNLLMGATFTGGTSLVFSGGAGIRKGESPRVTASVRLSVVPRPGDRSLTVFQDLSGGNSMELSARPSVPGAPAVTLQARNPSGMEAGQGYLGLTARTSTSRADAQAGIGIAYGGRISPEPPVLTARLSYATGIAFTRGRFGIARSIPDSFFMYAPDPSLSGERVDIRLDTGGSAPGAPGKVLVMPIPSYRTAIAQLFLPASDADVVARTSAALVSPRFRSGIFFTTDRIVTHSVSGILLDGAGRPVPYLTAEVLDFSGGSVTSTFTDESGRFELYELPEGVYTLVWGNDLGVTVFEIPPGSQRDLGLGAVTPEPAGGEPEQP